MSSICAIADVYNAMTTDRVYRKAIPSDEAYEYMMAAGYNIASQKALNAFLHCVTPFPVGAMVLLSTGDMGVVTKTNRNLPLRPHVYVPNRQQTIDLTSELSLTVLKTVNVDEVNVDQLIAF